MDTGKVSTCLAIGCLVWIGSVGAWAQQTATAVQDPVSAVECLKNKKKAPDCLRLGVLYAAGEEVAQDIPKALTFLDAACRADLPVGCRVQGWLLLNRHATPEESKQGLALVEKVCKQRDTLGCTGLGRAYVEGIGVTRDVRRGAEILEDTCSRGGGAACQALGALIERGEAPDGDSERRVRLIVTACGFGAVEACDTACVAGSSVACTYVREGASREAARSVYERGCAAGAAVACRRLASHVEDLARALALHERACALGDCWSCADAARAHYLGRGTAVDLAAAVRFYVQGCEKDSLAACITLGGIHARGELGADQVKAGETYLVKACGADVECRAVLAAGRIPADWGGSLEALSPRDDRHRGQGPIAIRGQIKEPRKIRHVSPEYPAEARQARIQGTVTLECVISETGAVIDIRVTSGPPELMRSAITAVRQWRYEPTLLNGDPVPVIMFVTVNFRIS